MLHLDRDDTPTPCLVQAPDTYALLVLPGTGRYAMVDGTVQVRTGPDGWLALPPSNGVRWDTAPWFDATTKARPLLHGGDVGQILSERVRCPAAARGAGR
jgi:hypothetical protein